MMTEKEPPKMPRPNVAPVPQKLYFNALMIFMADAYGLASEKRRIAAKAWGWDADHARMLR